MTIHDTSNQAGHIPSVDSFQKSIFPTFNVNVPMPIDTAIPGSYIQSGQQQSSSNPPSTKPAKGAGR